MDFVFDMNIPLIKSCKLHFGLDIVALITNLIIKNNINCVDT